MTTNKQLEALKLGRYKGKKHTEEARRRMSEAHKGKKLSDEHKRKISKKLIGKNVSEETRKKMSESRIGKNLSENAKRKLSINHKGKKLGKDNPFYGRKHSEETRMIIRSKKMGSNNHNWKGGITFLTNGIRNSFKYRQWRSDIFARDDFTCQECNVKNGGLLNAHHIKRFSCIFDKYKITTLEQALNCEEFWNLNNGITLCKKCHSKKRLK